MNKLLRNEKKKLEQQTIMKCFQKKSRRQKNLSEMKIRFRPPINLSQNYPSKIIRITCLIT